MAPRVRSLWPSIERLRADLSYDPETGRLTWARKVSRNVKIGQEAGYVHKQTGYRLVAFKIDGKETSLRAHVIIWAMVTGSYSRVLIDHRNRIGDDNRWINLREATVVQQNQNRGVKRNAKTGVKGVRVHGKGFYVSICADGVVRNIGAFKSLDDASAAYREASLKYHGEWSPFAK